MKFLLPLLMLSSCSHLFIPTIRSPYQLASGNDYLVSNLYTDPTFLKTTKQGLEVEYDLTIKNLQNKPRQVDLSSAHVQSRKRSVPMTCKSFKKNETKFEVAPAQQFRIQCTAHIPHNGQMGDEKLLLNIPLSGEFASFTYIVRAEELK